MRASAHLPAGGYFNLLLSPWPLSLAELFEQPPDFLGRREELPVLGVWPFVRQAHEPQLEELGAPDLDAFIVDLIAGLHATHTA
jgi:hypothetical protein